jgi:hypothetical protein
MQLSRRIRAVEQTVSDLFISSSLQPHFNFISVSAAIHSDGYDRILPMESPKLPLLALPEEILIQILGYILPYEVRKGDEPREFWEVLGCPRLRVFWSLITTHSILSRLAMTAVYSKASFKFIINGGQNINPFPNFRRQLNVVNLRRIRCLDFQFGPDTTTAAPTMSELLRAQTQGMSLQRLRIQTTLMVTRDFLPDGVSRKLVLELKYLISFEVILGPSNHTCRLARLTPEDVESIEELEREIAKRARKANPIEERESSGRYTCGCSTRNRHDVGCSYDDPPTRQLRWTDARWPESLPVREMKSTGRSSMSNMRLLGS